MKLIVNESFIQKLYMLYSNVELSNNRKIALCIGHKEIAHLYDTVRCKLIADMCRDEYESRGYNEKTDPNLYEIMQRDSYEIYNIKEGKTYTLPHQIKGKYIMCGGLQVGTYKARGENENTQGLIDYREKVIIPLTYKSLVGGYNGVYIGAYIDGTTHYISKNGEIIRSKPYILHVETHEITGTKIYLESNVGGTFTVVNEKVRELNTLSRFTTTMTEKADLIVFKTPNGTLYLNPISGEQQTMDRFFDRLVAINYKDIPSVVAIRNNNTYIIGENAVTVGMGKKKLAEVLKMPNINKVGALHSK